MTFQDAIRTCLNKFADFEGRAGLSEFWWFQLFYILVYIAIAGVAFTINLPWLVFLILPLIVPVIAASARRLHDTNRSGWWQLIAIIPLVGLVLIYFLVSSGDAGDNRFGAPAVN